MNKIAPDESIIIDLNDFEMPIYSEDREKIGGIPEKALKFKKLISECDGIVISLAEHNGAYTAAFKNIFDWCSIHDRDFLKGKKCIVISASPGARGGAGSNKVISTMFGFFGVEVLDNITIGLFEEKYQER